MTEWIVLAYIIYSWKKSLSKENKQQYPMAYKFLVAADFWVFLNLIVALFISIPAINFFTHGTHITVAHSMGSTIGINTTILLASALFIVSKLNSKNNTNRFLIRKGYLLFNVSLFLFWCSLLVAGVKKSHWMYFTEEVHFSEMQNSLYYIYIAFFVFGIGIATSIVMLSIPLLKVLFRSIKAD